MDRVIVQPGALPQDTDILNTNLFEMIDGAFKNAAVIGIANAVAGLACTPVTSSLQVNIATGSIFQVDPIDSAAYGSLGTNTASVVKQGILSAPATLTITPPGAVGFSQVYLVQAALQDVDAGSTVLSYYNSANPAQPYSGPNNSGTSNYTIRSCRCVVQLKAGVAATTGTQTTPSTDVGYVGLYAITVANGAAAIVSGNIVQLPSAPFFPTLPQVPVQVQQGTYVYAGQDTGAANAYVITFAAGQPIPTSYVAGMGVKFKALNANTAASTVAVNGLGAISIRRATGVALSAADINSGQIVELTYDGTNFQMANYLGSGATSNTTTAVSIPYVADSGTTNALIATYSPPITSGQLVAGLALEVKLLNTITGACTINVNGLGVKALKTGDLQNPPNALFVANEVLLIIYDGTQFQVANSTSLIYRKPSAALTIYVNTGTGSDTLYDGTSSTVVGGGSTAGPFATISKAVSAAFGYAPSQFGITISVAAGTYNEAVATPAFAGPNLTIDGGAAANVTINSGTGHSVVVQGPNTMTAKNVTVQNTSGGTLWGGFCAFNGATMTTVTTASNGIAGGVFYAVAGTVNPGNHIFNGSCNSLYLASTGGNIPIASLTHTISASISLSGAAATALLGGYVITSSAGPVTYVNPSFVSGPKYSAADNGVVNAQGLGVNYFPGTVAGTTQYGGQYIP